MNKKERAEVDELRNQLRLAKSLRFTETAEGPGIMPPKSGEPNTTGWTFNAYIGGSGPRAMEACSSSVHHGIGSRSKTTSQHPLSLYSTKLRALRAMRNSVELQCAEILAGVDAQIEDEKEML